MSKKPSDDMDKWAKKHRANHHNYTGKNKPVSDCPFCWKIYAHKHGWHEAAPGNYDPTDDRLLRLERERQSLKDEVSLQKKEIKAMRKDDGLFVKLAEIACELIGPVKPAKYAGPKAGTDIEETLVVHLSDEHCNLKFDSSMVGDLDHYDLATCMARAERLVDVTLSHTQNNLANYSFPHLVVLAYGDHVNGEIHDAMKYGELNNALKAAIACGQIHAQMIREMAPRFETVSVVYVPGNHGRRTAKKNFDDPHDNWDFLIAEIVRAMLADHSNVNVHVPNAFDCVLDINGWSFHVQHGDDIRSWNSIPWYGIERATRRLTSLAAANKKTINYFCLGHFHNLSSQQHSTGETFINGAWPATTPFIYSALKGYSKPMQLIHGVHSKHGASWRMPVYLKHDGDKDGPKRYSTSFAVKKGG